MNNPNQSIFQIADLCTVETNLSSSVSSPELEQRDEQRNDNDRSNGEETKTEKKSASELICLDDSSSSSQVDFGGINFENLTLGDFQDDDFDPRAAEPAPAPVLFPPPALPPRESKAPPTPTENNNNPFMTPAPSNGIPGLDDPFGMSSFSSTPAIAKPMTSVVSNNPLASLDDLDPFKNI